MSAQASQQIKSVREAIAALPEPTRTIYRMHLVDGLSYEAIATEFGTDPGHIERHIASAIVRIDRHLRRVGL